MMKINVPSNNKPERAYIINLIFGEFLGVEHTLKTSETEKNWQIILPNGAQLIIEDHFFNNHPNDKSYLKIENIPNGVSYAKNHFAPELDIPIIYGNDSISMVGNQIVCGMDIFASSFFMLTRWEEYANPTRDEHERFPAIASLAYKHNFLMRPVVNECLQMLWNMLVYLGYEGERKHRQFEIKLSHDVDSPYQNYYLCAKNLLRVMLGDVLKRRSPLSALKKLFGYIQFTLGRDNHDEFNTFDYLMTTSEKAGIKSNFYFLTGVTDKKFDASYKITDKRIIKMMQKISERGHLIGLHTSYNTYNNPLEVKREYIILKTQIDKLGIKQPNIGGRQHYLRWQAPITWRAWADAGLDYDSTVGYADHPGFRCGVCYPYQPFDVENQVTLDIIEYPLVVMECSVLDAKYQKMSLQEAQKVMLKLKNICQRYDGVFTLLWHNSYFTEQQYKDLYEVIFSYDD